jgi:hypothetical protein
MYYSDRNAIYYYTISEIIINKVALPNTFFISGIDAASNGLRSLHSLRHHCVEQNIDMIVC